MQRPNIKRWKERLFYTTTVNDEVSRMRAVVNNAILHLHPVTVPRPALRFTYTWGLGGISVFLGLLLGITGVLLMFRYDASVDRAYASIQELQATVVFGSLIRGVHHWSANLLVVTTFLHLLRVFLTGGYKNGRAMNWYIGVGLLLVVLAFNFTGYLLPWDQLAYWASTVGTSLLGYIPLVGEWLSRFLMGGSVIGQGTLRNFYAIHVAALPVLLVVLVSYHFWKIRKNGGISQRKADQKRADKVTTIPNLVQRELAVGATVLAVVLIFAMFTPAPLQTLANPAVSPNPAKAAWFFVGLQELLLHMHPSAAIGLIGIMLALTFLVPLLDRNGEDIGIYFRSIKGRWIAGFSAFIAADVVVLLVLLDENLLDLVSPFPRLSSAITLGLIPVGIALAILALVYFSIRTFFKANHSEALMGLFTFIMTALIVLTIIGVFFRGPNMAFSLPF